MLFDRLEYFLDTSFYKSIINFNDKNNLECKFNCVNQFDKIIKTSYLLYDFNDCEKTYYFFNFYSTQYFNSFDKCFYNKLYITFSFLSDKVEIDFNFLNKLIENKLIDDLKISLKPDYKIEFCLTDKFTYNDLVEIINYYFKNVYSYFNFNCKDEFIEFN